MIVTLMFFSALGFAVLLWAALCLWLRPLEGVELQLHIDGEAPSLEVRVRALVWLRAGLGNVRIVLVDQGLEPAAREIARQLCLDHCGIVLEERGAATWMKKN